MIKVHFYRYIDNYVRETDVTDTCETVTIKGDKSQCARECELNMVYSLYDKNHDHEFPYLGDLIKVYDDSNKLIFKGMVMARTLDGDEKANITAYDPIIHLTKSNGTYNFKKTTPEAIASQIAKEAGLKIGSLANTGIKVDLISDGGSMYSTIMQAYRKASIKNGKKYIPMMDGDKFNIIEKGTFATNIVLSTDTNVSRFSYEDDLEDMVNRVKIYSDKGKQIGLVQNDKWVSKYGVFQEIVQKEDEKDMKSVANKMLKGVNQSFNIEARGILSCKAGYSVKVEIPYIDISRNAVMYIDGDTHTWNLGSGDYSMHLFLNLTNIMDEEGSD